LSWSRHFRCFPGQGDLPIVAFSEAVAATSYSGPQSLEIFNDQFRAAPPRQMAIDGKRSLIWLEDQIARGSNERQRDFGKLPPEAICRGVEFVEFAMDMSAAPAFRKMLGAMGFRLVGRHISKSVEHWRQGSINFVVNTEEKGFAHSHQVTHGPGVCAIALSVADAPAAMARAQRLKVDPFRQEVGPGELTIPAIRGVGGSLIYFTEPRDDLSQLWSRDFKAVDTKAVDGKLAHIDHLAQNMAYNEMQSWHLFYRSIFDLDHTPQVDIVDPSGLVQSEALVSADGSLRIALNGSMAPRTQSAQLLSDYFGAGVQHLALETPDLLGAVEAMRERGLAFLEIPDNYYEDLRAKYDLDDDFAERLRRNGVLYDRDERGVFLQIYTNRFAERFFFEIVQRDSYIGFGAANATVRLAAQARANRVANNR
jgi:4-hydroxyphenylpyruvate dioxygenase